MHKINKKKIYWFIKNNGLYSVLSFASLVIVGIVIIIFNHYKMYTGDNQIQIFDFTIFFTITVALFLQNISNSLAHIMLKHLEDAAKLSINYSELVKRYTCSKDGISFLEYNNVTSNINNVNIARKRVLRKNLNCIFPITIDFYVNGNKLTINDSDIQYIMPPIIQEHFSELFDSHITSNIYNQLNIRVDNWWSENDIIYMNTSRTTYFDSLVTNRSIDYQWNDGRTTRDYFQYGPYIPTLSESKLSNHLGFNGFIETIDGFIPLVKRSNLVSIGKYTYGDSIGASMKVKYALNNKQNLDESGIITSIYQEIADELKINQSDLECITFHNNIICAYRDFVEGGKPQLMFYAKTKLTREEMTNNFLLGLKAKKKEQKRNKWDKELKELEDGEKLLWINVNNLPEIAVVPEGIAYQGKFYEMMPSASGCLVILINYLCKNNNCEG